MKPTFSSPLKDIAEKAQNRQQTPVRNPRPSANSMAKEPERIRLSMTNSRPSNTLGNTFNDMTDNEDFPNVLEDYKKPSFPNPVKYEEPSFYKSRAERSPHTY